MFQDAILHMEIPLRTRAGINHATTVSSIAGKYSKLSFNATDSNDFCLYVLSPSSSLCCTVCARDARQKPIPVRIHISHAQSAWTPFLHRVARALGLEDIEGVYEGDGGAPVVRIASLVDGGLYFARPTEVRYTEHLKQNTVTKKSSYL